QLRNKDMGLELTDNARRYLAKKGYDPVLGARPLRRTIQRDLEDSLSEQILFNELRPGQIVLVDCEGDPDNIEKSKLVFKGADRGPTVPDAVPADLGAAAAEE
ncbi:NDP-hexose 4-ketoreductase, partial [Wangella sp. NEAU-J3]|nr:NDP-hexose 4-ketoreductase [Jidongwangia harbinensis]